MSTYKYDKAQILEATNKGLEIIIRCYPDQSQAIDAGRNFKTHEEKNPSSSLVEADDAYLVKNFTSGETLNPFDVIIETQPNVITFTDALKWAVATFNLQEGTTFGGAKLEFKEATEDQKNGEYYFDYKDQLTSFELSVLGPLVDQDICNLFKVKSVHSFTQIKQYHKDNPKHTKQYEKYGNVTQQIITQATDTYPIFVIDQGDWQKIYQPLNSEKQYRFRYIGSKPDNHIFGLDTLDKLLLKYRKDLLKKRNDLIEKRANEKKKEPTYLKIKDIQDKLPSLIIGSGDRDSLNISSLGYPVVWLNSESAILTWDQYNHLKEYTYQLYYLGDIDLPGIREGIKMGLKFIDLKVIWLPEIIKKKKYRGKPGKDLKDWVDLYFNEDKPFQILSKFKTLVSNALPARFWDMITKDGKFQGYSFNREAVYQFLYYQGFRRIEEETAKEDYSFIRIQNGIVKRVKVHEVATFHRQYLREQQKGIPLLNYMHRSGRLTEQSLSDLPKADIDFTDCTPDSQLYFFKNEIWNITSDSITNHKYGSIETPVWKDKVIPYKVRIDKNPVFNITEKNGVRDIEILRTDNHFFNFLINTSRIHWKVCGNDPFVIRKSKIINEHEGEEREKLLQELTKEYEVYHKENAFNIAEKGLTAKQIQEQKLHLISKIYALGYLFHKYKKFDEAFIPFGVDNKVSEISDANGGTGKSITFNIALKQVIRVFKDIDGSDKKKYESDFLFQGVTKHTDLINIEDASQYFPWNSYKGKTTAGIEVNGKNTPAFTLSYQDSPKMCATSNFGVFNMNSTLARRFLFVVYSDYYHFKIKGLFKPTHNPKMDFGKELFTDFDAKEHNDFFNLTSQICQFFINTPDRIDPPQGNIEKRNAIQSIGDAFYNWGISFFSEQKNTYIAKKDALESCRIDTGDIKLSSQKFKEKLIKWCDIYDYEFNPEESLASNGLCKYTYQGSTRDFIYIRTQDRPVKTFNDWKRDRLNNVPVKVSTPEPKTDLKPGELPPF